MMIEGKEAAVATEAANVPSATEISLGTDTGIKIGAVMISTVERGEELRVGIATATARNEIEEERGMS